MATLEIDLIQDLDERISRNIEELDCLFDTILQMDDQEDTIAALDRAEVKIHSAKDTKRSFRMEYFLLSDPKIQNKYKTKYYNYEKIILIQCDRLQHIVAKKEQECCHDRDKKVVTTNERSEDGFTIETQDSYLEYMLKETGNEDEEIYDVSKDVLREDISIQVKESRDDESIMLHEYKNMQEKKSRDDESSMTAETRESSTLGSVAIDKNKSNAKNVHTMGQDSKDKIRTSETILSFGVAEAYLIFKAILKKYRRQDLLKSSQQQLQKRRLGNRKASF